MLHIVALTILAAANAASSNTSTFVLQSATDFVLGGGAGVQAAPLNSLRSGNPGQHSTAALALALSPGIVIDRLTCAYRYDTGYGPSGTGKTMMANALASMIGKKVLMINFPSLGTNQAGAILKLVFREAKIHDAILFFDECESIFMDRTKGNMQV